MNNDFGKYQELVNNWAKKNDMVFVLPVFLDLFKQIEKEGRVEGAIDFAKRVRGVLKVGLTHNETLEGFEEAFIELENELQGVKQ